MREFVGIIAAFAVMPVLLKKKMSFGNTLILCAIIIAIVGGIPFNTFVASLASVFTVATTLQTLIIILLIGILGSLMKDYGFLTRIITDLKQVIRSNRKIIMLLPAAMGLLNVPGGAYLSAPFADTIGKEMELSPAKRAAVNLSFRHISMLIVPFSTSLIYVQGILPELNIAALCLLNLGFVIIMQTAAYLLYLRKAKVTLAPVSTNRTKSMLNLLFSFAPIYLIVLLNGVLGLKLIFAVLISVLLTLLYCVISTKDIKGCLTSALKGIKLQTTYMMIGIYLIKNLINNLEFVKQTFVSLFTTSTNSILILIIIALANLLFGITTGLIYVSLGIFLPLLAGLGLSPEMLLVYTSFVYCCAFLGYFYSPLHLCQVLSIQAIGCTTGQVFKENLKLIPFTAVCPFILFYVNQLVMQFLN